MSCCNNPINLGCFNYCSTIDTGYEAVQTGDHSLEVYLVNGVDKSIPVTISSGNNIIVPTSVLNENKEHQLKVLQPDGTYFEFDTDIYCVTFTTKIEVS